MSDTILTSILLCGLSLVVTLMVLRSSGLSLGLPFAYLSSLHLQHVPGAYAHLARPDLFATTPYVATGIWQTAIGSLCFVAGLLVSRYRARSNRRNPRFPPTDAISAKTATAEPFWRFCLIGGWVFVYGLSPLREIPSLGALIEKGAAIWMLGVMLGLRNAVARSRLKSIVIWLSALAVYPSLGLLLGGFLSYGSAAAMIVVSVLVVSVRRTPRILVGIVVATIIGLSIFVNYFIARDQIRSVTWSGASFGDRVDTVIDAFSQFSIIDISDDKHAESLDQRLNQNYFIGLAADRLDNGFVGFRQGASFYEALIAPIPRALWPDKPVFGGSGTIVRDMTGLNLSETTSWGVGQVMEFYINFGWWSLVLGFAALGWLIGQLDIKAAAAERRGDIRILLICFLPAVALVQPIGSLVELAGGGLSAYFAAIGWSHVWTMWANRRRRRAATP